MILMILDMPNQILNMKSSGLSAIFRLRDRYFRLLKSWRRAPNYRVVKLRPRL